MDAYLINKKGIDKITNIIEYDFDDDTFIFKKTKKIKDIDKFIFENTESISYKYNYFDIND